MLVQAYAGPRANRCEIQNAAPTSGQTIMRPSNTVLQFQTLNILELIDVQFLQHNRVG